MARLHIIDGGMILAVAGEMEERVGRVGQDEFTVALSLLATNIRLYFNCSLPLDPARSPWIFSELYCILKDALQLFSRIYHSKGHWKPGTSEISEVSGLFEDAMRYLYMITTNIFASNVFMLDHYPKHLPRLVHKLWLENAQVKQLQLKSSKWCVRRISRHALERQHELGRGSHATVYKGKWNSIDVAEKEIFGSEGWEWNEPWLKKELDMHNKVQFFGCTNILRVLGYCGEKNDRKSLILEAMDYDLGKFIRETPIPKRQECTTEREFQTRCVSHLRAAVHILLQIAKGMRVLHSNDVVHRDLKPLNVLIKDGFRLVAKVADFGCAKDHFNSNDIHSLNTGTRPYWAPEMFIRGTIVEASYTRAVDVYSFAIICSEILTGAKPLSEQGTRRTLPMADAIPAVLNELVNRCLVTEAQSRPNFDWICRRLWLSMQVLSGESPFAQFSENVNDIVGRKLSMWLKNLSKPDFANLTFEQICGLVGIEPKDVMTDIHLCDDLVPQLKLLSDTHQDTLWHQLLALKEGLVKERIPAVLKSYLANKPSKQGWWKLKRGPYFI